MRTSTFLLTLFLLSRAFLFSEESAFPDNFIVKYQALTFGTLYHIEAKEGYMVGKVFRDKQRGEGFFSYLNLENRLIARAHTNTYYSETVVHVFDSSGQKIGRLVGESFTLYPKEYRIYDATDHLVAKGGLNWIGSRFTLVDPSNPHIELITFHRPYFGLMSDHWHGAIHQPGKIDHRLYVILSAFQAYLEVKSFEK